MLEVVGQTKANVGKSSKEDNEAYNGFKKTLKIALSGRCLFNESKTYKSHPWKRINSRL